MQYRGDTHNKKPVLQSIRRGMTPIAKNIIVVDETGKEYEATYSKRAKGLVKSGRARFIEENKICLLCPPEIELEDKTMSENKLTAREIFEKITELQKQLAEDSNYSLQGLGDYISSICYSSDDDGGKSEQVTEICNVFRSREITLMHMLEFYETMYHDLNSETKKVDNLKSAFSGLIESINKSDFASEDKFAAIGDITEKIADLTERILLPAPTRTAQQKIADEMTEIIRNPSSSMEQRENTTEILKVYMSGN